jgi:response regulator RpfG family c-di-GMP phosphodiesterase
MEKFNKPKILFVFEDLRTASRLISSLSKTLNYNIITANNRSKTIDNVLKDMPDLIIMELNSQEINTVNTTMQIKSNFHTQDIPIIIITDENSSPEKISTALFNGAIDVIKETINLAEFNAKISSIVKFTSTYKKIKEENISLQEQMAHRLVDMKQLESLKEGISKKLYTLKTNTESKEIRNAIAEIEDLIMTKTNKLNWNNIKLQIESMFPDLIYKLSEKKLTNYELQLCAYIRLNMNSKQISSLMYTSSNTINIARKRLKKKLGLSAGESLQLYIHNI